LAHEGRLVDLIRIRDDHKLTVSNRPKAEVRGLDSVAARPPFAAPNF
jgi:hypothetical protein